MMPAEAFRTVELIPLEKIKVLNPRSRDSKKHREIVDNIAAVGLKRPITVRRRMDRSDFDFDLVCGEGRLQAFRALGELEIPAVIIDAEENDCLVMSLVENIARRKHRPIDIMQDIGTLHRRGYSDNQIAEKIGYTASWVNMVVQLLERGEERLLTAVETGLIPMSLAVDIARAETGDAQKILLEAYETGKVKGKKLGVARRLLDQRFRQGRKGLTDNGLGRSTPSRKISTADLMRLYQREAEKQRILVKKSDFTQARLLFLVEALKDLFSDEGFTTLLRAEGLATLPKILAARTGRESVL
jgi:ParB family chromosome partitioning protein